MGYHRHPHEVGSRACLVSTCPDDTQRAIAKVMRCKGFSHARVLNLSDVRQVESNRFLDDLKNDCLPPRPFGVLQRESRRVAGTSQIKKRNCNRSLGQGPSPSQVGRDRTGFLQIS